MASGRSAEKAKDAKAAKKAEGKPEPDKAPEAAEAPIVEAPAPTEPEAPPAEAPSTASGPTRSEWLRDVPAARSAPVHQPRTRLRILACDPGRKVDPFGVVLLDWHASLREAERKGWVAGGSSLPSTHRPCIVVHEAAQFIGRPYREVAARIKEIGRQAHPDLVLVESNGSEGRAALAAMEAAGVQRLRAVACGGPDITEQTMQAGTAYSKQAMVDYLRSKIDKRLVVWGGSSTLGELRQQLREFVSRRSPSGIKTYSRQRGRHDDLAMALLLGCSAARRAELEWESGAEAQRRSAAEQEAAALARAEARQAAEAARMLAVAGGPEDTTAIDAHAKAMVVQRQTLQGRAMQGMQAMQMP